MPRLGESARLKGEAYARHLQRLQGREREASTLPICERCGRKPARWAVFPNPRSSRGRVLCCEQHVPRWARVRKLCLKKQLAQRVAELLMRGGDS